MREERLRTGQSQEELAHASGLHRTYLGAVERGERNITLGSLYAISDALNVRVTELLQAGRSLDSP